MTGEKIIKSNMKVLLYLFFCVYFSLCFGKQVALQERIVNGENTEITEIPYVCILYAGVFQCTCSIYSSTIVITAAHCARTCVNKFCSFRVGETDYTKAPDREVLFAYVHPKYNDYTFSNDIALLKLAEPLTFNDRIQPIALQEDETEVVTGAPVLIAGWGRLSEDGETTEILQSATVNIVDRYECNKNYSCEDQKCDEICCENAVVDETMICAAAPKTDTCQGDSGGPMVLKSSGKQIGITSWGIGCARENYPGVYTYVPEFIEWIEKCANIAGILDIGGIIDCVAEPLFKQ